jgi:hypothetical protein
MIFDFVIVGLLQIGGLFMETVLVQTNPIGLRQRQGFKLRHIFVRELGGIFWLSWSRWDASGMVSVSSWWAVVILCHSVQLIFRRLSLRPFVCPGTAPVGDSATRGELLPWTGALGVRAFLPCATDQSDGPNVGSLSTWENCSSSE